MRRCATSRSRCSTASMGPPPPLDARFEIEALYRPAEAQLEVGGDWYDTFELPDGKLGIVVGDVVGRGLPAAAAMGQLRSAVRALALTGLGPAAVIRHLDTFVDDVEATQYATLAYAEVDPGHRRRHVLGRRAPAAGAVRSAAGVHGRPLDAAGRRDARRCRGARRGFTLAPGRRVRALHRRSRRAPQRRTSRSASSGWSTALADRPEATPEELAAADSGAWRGRGRRVRPRVPNDV